MSLLQNRYAYCAMAGPSAPVSREWSRFLRWSTRISRLFQLSGSVVIGRVEVKPRPLLKRPHIAHELITVPAESVERSILLVRSQKVILDRSLATLYGVSTSVLNQAVKRNPERFPPDFMFQLTIDEASALRATRSRSQIVILKQARGKNTKYMPYAFTEHGILMLSSVLRSERAIQVNIQIMRTFIRLREMLASSTELNSRLDALERSYDGKFKMVFEAIRQLMRPGVFEQKPIGFRAKRPRK